MRTRTLVVLAGLLVARAGAQTILFDFDNAPLYAPLPMDVTAGGITAHLAATGQGYSIQSASTAPVAPVGFSGHYLYPSSVYAADLAVTFSQPLTAFSIQYAPQELACDDSATMRVTAYLNTLPVGTSTTNATALCVCTWQVQTLSITTTQYFNNVVVHYDARPPLCQDWGPIFLADNMTVTLAPPPIIPTDVAKSPGGPFQFSFTNTPSRPFTVFGTTNPTQPFSNWTALGMLVESPPGQFQFTDSQATNLPQRFYRVSSP